MRAIAALLLSLSSLFSADLGLCYDRARWSETAALSRMGGTSVFNIDDGRGRAAKECSEWDAFKKRCQAVGGKILGYVDFLDTNGVRKPDSVILTEASQWITAGYDGVWLDDVRDTSKDGALAAAIVAKHAGKTVIANPGTAVKGVLKKSGAILCEHESNTKINWKSVVVIAFVETSKEAADVRAKAVQVKTRFVAVEPRSSYHVGGVEYQAKNPFALK
jgi:hypothetical protein